MRPRQPIGISDQELSEYQLETIKGGTHLK